MCHSEETLTEEEALPRRGKCVRYRTVNASNIRLRCMPRPKPDSVKKKTVAESHSKPLEFGKIKRKSSKL